MEISAGALLSASLYFLVGILRTLLKGASLASRGKIASRNDDFAAFKYMLTTPSLGDVLFLPCQLLYLSILSFTLIILRVTIFLLK